MTKDKLGGDEALSKILPANGDWELVCYNLLGKAEAICCDTNGNIYFSDIQNQIIWRIQTNGLPEKWLENLPTARLKFGPDGQIYATAKTRIIAIDPTTKDISEIVTGVKLNSLIVSKAGHLYFTDISSGQVQMLSLGQKN